MTRNLRLSEMNVVRFRVEVVTDVDLTFIAHVPAPTRMHLKGRGDDYRDAR
jgi:hypothetical protein